MAKYRAVILAPRIVEVECDPAQITKQLSDIADGMGKATSMVRKKYVYKPVVLEAKKQ